ncbi:MAG TPA: hypothetical protein VE224_07260, partial [Pseudolabrys sp.]|nr:hypothetical protein [Pseudolabrys sp.]
MSLLQPTHAAADPAPDTPADARAAGPRLPVIDAGPIILSAAENWRAIPEFDGEDGGTARAGLAALARQIEDAAEAAARAWPGFQPAGRYAGAPGSGARHPGRGRATGDGELDKLRDIRARQADALRQARDQIVGLDDTVKLLRARLAQQEKDTAAAQRAAESAAAEAAALRAELDNSNANFAELRQRSADLNTAFDEREQELAVLRGSVATLKGQLATRATETDLTAAIEDAKARYYRDFTKRYAQFEAQIEKLAHL